eukprot:gene10892-12694_t
MVEEEEDIDHLIKEAVEAVAEAIEEIDNQQRSTKYPLDSLRLAVRSLVILKSKTEAHEHDTGLNMSAAHASSVLSMIPMMLHHKMPQSEIVQFFRDMNVPKDIKFFTSQFWYDMRAYQTVLLVEVLKEYAGRTLYEPASEIHGTVLRSLIMINDYKSAMEQFNMLSGSQISSVLIHTMVSAFIEMGAVDEARKLLYRHQNLAKKPFYIRASVELCLAMGNVRLARSFLMFLYQSGPTNVETSQSMIMVQNTLLMCRKYNEMGVAQELYETFSSANDVQAEILTRLMIDVVPHDQVPKYRARLDEIRKNLARSVGGRPLSRDGDGKSVVNKHTDSEFVEFSINRHKTKQFSTIVESPRIAYQY